MHRGEPGGKAKGSGALWRSASVRTRFVQLTSGLVGEALSVTTNVHVIGECGPARGEL